MEVDQSLNLKTDTLFDRAVLSTATGLFALTIVLTTIQVFVRWLELPTFGFLHWTQPAAKFLLIVATYLGAAVAMRNDEHISIQFMLEWVEERHATLGRALDVFSDLVVVGFLGVALRATAMTAADSWTTSIGGIGFVTSGYLYLGISVGVALTMLYAVADFVITVKQIVSGRDTHGQESERTEGTVDE